MGYNTVAVLYNDMTHEMPDRMKRAVTHSVSDKTPSMDGWFGFGQVISQAHADVEQVVVIGRNTGRTVDKANELGPWALEQMAECLKRHGYTVKKSR